MRCLCFSLYSIIYAQRLYWVCTSYGHSKLDDKFKHVQNIGGGNCFSITGFFKNFCCKMTEEIRKSDFARIPLVSIRSDSVCWVIFMLSHSAGAQRRTGFGGLGCLCCWQEQVKEQTQILLWECVSCAHLQGRIMDFFLFVCLFIF